MRTLTEAKKELSILLNEIDIKQREIDNFELDNSKYEDSYCEMLDECSTVKIGSLEYDASRVLREVDPTAYRCGLNDYVDSLDVSDDSDYQELENELSDLISQKDDLEYEIEELKTEEKPEEV